jgi:hemolysin III
VLLRGRWRVVLLALVWGLALLGIAAKWVLPWPTYWLTVSLYIAMGWVGLPSIWQLIRAVGLRGMFWSFLGGLLYILGGVCDAARWPILLPGVIGYHEILHLLDMGGTLIHVFFVIRYILPFRC